jgi:predicted GNAT family acetyltransferase
MDLTVVDVPEASRYEARSGASVPAFAAYRRDEARPGVLIFTHTEVDPAFEGQGVGGRLARAALDDVRARGLRIVPQCPFISSWIAKHPDYEDLVAR